MNGWKARPGDRVRYGCVRQVRAAVDGRPVLFEVWHVGDRAGHVQAVVGGKCGGTSYRTLSGGDVSDLAAVGVLGVDRVRVVEPSLADVVEFERRARPLRFVSAWDRKRLGEIAAMELAACDAGNLREALRLSELYETTAEAMGAE